MSEKDLLTVCSSIDAEKEFLNEVSQEIWKMPELRFKEVHAHAVLTSALKRYDFEVEKHYLMPTAFRAEYRSKTGPGSTVAILLEYDALPAIGHACGHNLIAEAGLAAAIAVKKAMEEDSEIMGKVIVLGTPAEEGGGGKIRLMELGAFDGIDAAMMVHPSRISFHNPNSSTSIVCLVQYHGNEAHAAGIPWEGRNALDAAVACYNNLSMLRQQVKPECRIHVIIIEGGVSANVIPAISTLKLSIRAPTVSEAQKLQRQVEGCIRGAATATGCKVDYNFDGANSYHNLISNQVLSDVYKKHGINFEESLSNITFSTDLGNVSHIIPSIQPLFAIPTVDGNHTKGFCEAAGLAAAQEPTLVAAKALAMTCLTLFRSKEVMEEAKKQLLQDVSKD